MNDGDAMGSSDSQDFLTSGGAVLGCGVAPRAAAAISSIRESWRPKLAMLLGPGAAALDGRHLVPYQTPW